MALIIGASLLLAVRRYAKTFRRTKTVSENLGSSGVIAAGRADRTIVSSPVDTEPILLVSIVAQEQHSESNKTLFGGQCQREGGHSAGGLLTSGFGGSQKTWRYFEVRILNIVI